MLRHPCFRQALAELRKNTAAGLREFNGTVPYARRLRRSAMDRFTTDPLWAGETAPQRRYRNRWVVPFGCSVFGDASRVAGLRETRALPGVRRIHGGAGTDGRHSGRP